MCHCSSPKSSYSVRSTRSSLSALFEITGHHHDHDRDRPHRLTSILVIGLCGIHAIARIACPLYKYTSDLFRRLPAVHLASPPPFRPISANLCYRCLTCRMQSGKGFFVRLATASPALSAASQRGALIIFALGARLPRLPRSPPPTTDRACCQRVRLCACAPANLNSVKIASA